ncbi:hypothetical protein TI39_contig342g00018 [Zymoseptoria brevis]|uniref:Uncharacterized protein n=1 Tax=Zymoseptoria brevis TaxID=1047168 RepID=A0A0F4GV70_9PEZI|nr:hypothetical protein TI39_contig342g00018 [Zymoseptoria brevis]
MGWLDLVPRAGNLYIGGLHALYQKPDLFKAAKITHIVSVLDYDLYENDHFKHFKHIQIKLDDDPNEVLLKHFSETNAFIDNALSNGGAVFVHCAMGKSRSATIVCCYLMWKYNISPEVALAQLCEGREVCDPNQGFKEQLKVYEFMLKAPNKAEAQSIFQKWLDTRYTGTWYSDYSDSTTTAAVHSFSIHRTNDRHSKNLPAFFKQRLILPLSTMPRNTLPLGQGRVTSFEMFREVKYRHVTRLQLEIVRSKFEFLELPGEIRNAIYRIVFAVGFENIQDFFDKQYARISVPGLTDQQRVIDKKQLIKLKRSASSPSIFLLNKQIYRESRGLFDENTAVFHHGLLSCSKLYRVIAPKVLRTVHNIEITDHGHPIVEKVILRQSWNGYTRLIKQLAAVLSKGNHNLKNLTINFTDPAMVQHMTTCVHAIYHCGFRDQMRDALDHLRRVRGVGNVVFKGLNPQQSAELKAIMETPPKTFYDLPRELRDTIYDMSLDWSTISTSINRVVPNKSMLFPAITYPKRTTPTILLLSKTTTSEALSVLHKKPLTLTFPAAHDLPNPSFLPVFNNFISSTLLSNVRKLHITVESWEWLASLNAAFFSTLTKLEVFKLKVTDEMKDLMLKSPVDGYPDKQMHKYLKELETLQGLKEVEITGDIPEGYAKALEGAMTGDGVMPAVPGVGLWRFPTIGGKFVSLEEEMALDLA